MLGSGYPGQDCRIAQSLGVVGERWTLLIVRDAFFGVRRFNEFHTHLDIPKAVLADRLRGLVAAGVLERSADPERPSRDVYTLTGSGERLWPVIHALHAWGESQFSAGPARRSYWHVDCDAQIDATGRCAACGRTPPATEISTTLRAGLRDGRDDPVTVALGEPRRLLTPLDTHLRPHPG